LNPIRPNFPLVTTPRPQRPEARAAQRAFFDAVQQATPVARAATSEPVKAAAPVQRAAAETPQPPQRYLRPGSLLDIKV
jgi:hypothetical protein